MPSRWRRLIAVALAVLVVAALVTVDAVTLTQAKPSFDKETRAFHQLLESSTSTTVPRRTTTGGAARKTPTGAAVTSTTASP